MTPFYRFSRATMRLLLAGLADLSLSGCENVPAEGPLIVVSNHLNNADPPLLGAVLPRFIHYMTKEELYRSPWGRLFATAYGAFPVHRGMVDRRALARAQALLRAGEVVGMFPEGHRSPCAALQPAFDGAALIARRTGAPVLPVAIVGTEAVFRGRPRWAIRVRVGPAFTVPSGGPLRQATRDMMMHVSELLPPSYRGAYPLPSRYAA
ncbi:MAG: lysophospholipid acyltransferase family protein [Chloroflexota bacterium]